MLIVMKYCRPSGSYVAFSFVCVHAVGNGYAPGFWLRHGGSSSSRFSMPTRNVYRSLNLMFVDAEKRLYAGSELKTQPCEPGFVRHARFGRSGQYWCWKFMFHIPRPYPTFEKTRYS